MSTSNAFFYGTVMLRQPNHGDLKQARFLGEAETAPRYRLFRVDESYPALAEDGSSSIAGELYELDEEGWDRIAQLDPPWMARRAIELVDGSQVQSMLVTGAPPPEVTWTDISRFGGWRAYLAAQGRASS